MKHTLNKFDLIWLVASAIALVVIAFPYLIWFGLIFFLLPGLILSVWPTLVLYMTPAYFTFRFSGFVSVGGWRLPQTAAVGLGIASLLGAILWGAVAAQHHNTSAKKNAAELTSDDVRTDRLIPLPRVIAVKSMSPNGYASPDCKTICQRLLLLKGVDQIIVPWADPSKGTEGNYAYSMSKLPKCPNSKELGWRLGHIVGAMGKPSTHKLLREEADKGNCITRINGRVEDAQLMLSFSKIERSRSKFSDPWSLAPKLLGATKMEVFNKFGEILFRQTEVKYLELSTPLYIGLKASIGYPAPAYAGWARKEVAVNPLGQQGWRVLPNVFQTEAFD